MSLSIFDDEDLVESLGYSARLDRHDYMARTRSFSVRRSALMAREAPTQTVRNTPTRDRLRDVGHVLSSLTARELRAIASSPLPAATVAQMLGLHEIVPCAVYVRRAARAVGMPRPSPRDVYAAKVTPERRAVMTAREHASRARMRAEREARKARIAERRRAA
ncbi:MAG: hypothetical protein IPK80_02550 [Nannocystis sp.]|nr:hypothetical protein [Nannocystis sp.]